LIAQQIKNLLSNTKVIAVVGLSADPSKASNHVSAYLQQKGYQIIPVNPTIELVLDQKSYKSLLDIPEDLQKTIDIVDIFRRSDDVPSIIEQAIQLKMAHGKLLAVWMQLGIVNQKAAEDAKKAGLMVIMDKCLMVEHKRYF
jgi:predicted CoA-binding protein